MQKKIATFAAGFKERHTKSENNETLQIIALNFIGVCPDNLSAQTYDSYTGPVMAGYQGRFTTPGDGSDRGRQHYGGKNGFAPGSCSITP
jgi:hypothetical protein